MTAEIDTMLTMVKDGNWFRLAHRHPFSMAFYRARPGVDTMKRKFRYSDSAADVADID